MSMARWPTSLRTIRGRLLLSANATLGVFVIVLLVLNARREFANAVTHQAATLEDEAAAIFEAVLHLADEHGIPAVQEYVDGLSRGMQGSHSADHYVLIKLGTELILPSGMELGDQRRLSRVLGSAAPADTAVALQGRSFAIGSRRSSLLAVHVLEESTGIRRAIRRDALIQFGVLTAIGVIAAGVMNLVLLRRIAVPLNQLSQMVRRIADGEYGSHAGTFSGAELQELADAVSTMSDTLADDASRRTALMRSAHAIQQHLLPQNIELPGLRAASLFLPAEDVAGDYYDVLPLNDGTWMICLADVMGHGVPAAMGAAILKALVVSAIEAHQSPAEILGCINRRFTQTLPPGFFASMFVGRWSPETQTLEYSSAGHLPALLWPSSAAERRLTSTGLLVGLEPSATWETRSCHIGHHDQLILFTDGITEALNPKNEVFGLERLRGCRALSRFREPAETVQSIQHALQEHHSGRDSSDDCTLLVIEGVCTDCRCPCQGGDSETLNEMRDVATVNARYSRMAG